MNVVFSRGVEAVSENGRANLEYIDMRFGAPVCVGDTIEAESTVLGVKASSRERDRGVVHVGTVGRNQDGEVVLAYQRKVQVWKGDPDAPVAEGEAPAFAGDTVFAITEIRGLGDLPGRPDLGVLDTVLRGHKFVRKGGAAEKVEIFYLEREIAVKRRSHYA